MHIFKYVVSFKVASSVSLNCRKHVVSREYAPNWLVHAQLWKLCNTLFIIFTKQKQKTVEIEGSVEKLIFANCVWYAHRACYGFSYGLTQKIQSIFITDRKTNSVPGIYCKIDCCSSCLTLLIAPFRHRSRCRFNDFPEKDKFRQVALPPWGREDLLFPRIKCVTCEHAWFEWLKLKSCVHRPRVS